VGTGTRNRDNTFAVECEEGASAPLKVDLRESEAGVEVRTKKLWIEADARNDTSSSGFVLLS